MVLYVYVAGGTIMYVHTAKETNTLIVSEGVCSAFQLQRWTSYLMTGRKELRTRGITGAKKMLVDYCTCSRFCTTGSRKANSGLDLRKPAILDIPPSRN